jgi:hypothetical protein
MVSLLSKENKSNNSRQLNKIVEGITHHLVA